MKNNNLQIIILFLKYQCWLYSYRELRNVNTLSTLFITFMYLLLAIFIDPECFY